MSSTAYSPRANHIRIEHIQGFKKQINLLVFVKIVLQKSSWRFLNCISKWCWTKTPFHINDISYQISPRHFSGFRMTNHYLHSNACLLYILRWPRKVVNKGWETKPNSSLQLVCNWPFSISPRIPYQWKSWTNNIRVATFRPGLARSAFKYQYKNSI